jgi:hypothetical protein
LVAAAVARGCRAAGEGASPVLVGGYFRQLQYCECDDRVTWTCSSIVTVSFLGLVSNLRAVAIRDRNRNNEQGQTDSQPEYCTLYGLHNKLHAYVERALHLFLSATNNPEPDKNRI